VKRRTIRHELRSESAAENDELGTAVYDELRAVMLHALRHGGPISDAMATTRRTRAGDVQRERLWSPTMLIASVAAARRSAARAPSWRSVRGIAGRERVPSVLEETATSEERNG
jgi:hypothetical protein